MRLQPELQVSVGAVLERRVDTCPVLCIYPGIAYPATLGAMWARLGLTSGGRVTRTELRWETGRRLLGGWAHGAFPSTLRYN